MYLQPQQQQQGMVMSAMQPQTQAMLQPQQPQAMHSMQPQTQAMLGSQIQPQLQLTDMMLTTQAMSQTSMTSTAAYTVLQQPLGQAVQQQQGPGVLLQSGSPGTTSSLGDCPVGGVSGGALASLQQQQQQQGRWAAVGANWQPVLWT
jgi:hypothetical protein